MLLMRLGEGIGKGLNNRTGRAGFWAHGKGEVDGGCFSARVGGGVAIVARVTYTAGRPALDEAAGVTTTSSPDLNDDRWP